MKNEILRMEQVTTIEDGATMLNHFNLHIFRGEIMGLLCLNQIGEKSLIHLISQNSPLHYGRVYFNEELVNNYQHSPMTYNKVAVIEQYNHLADNLTVSDNVFILRPGVKKYFINPRTLNGQLKRIMIRLGIQIDGSELAANLTPFEKYSVELLRAVIMGAKLIVLKDISNSISTADLLKFHSLLRYFSSKGTSFLYICSHHEEAFKICDHIALMRDGHILKILDPDEYDRKTMLPFYVGEYKGIVTDITKTSHQNEKILEFRDVCTDNMNHMSFSIIRGECTVLLDMNNTVLQDIADLMTGRIQPLGGEIRYCGKPFCRSLAQRPISNGIAFIMQDPARSMTFQDMSYLDNLCFLIGEKQHRLPLNRQIKKYISKTYQPLVGDCIYSQSVRNLTLQQFCDLVYYRVELSQPNMVFCMRPFDGLDMYLRMHLITLLEDMKKKKITVILLMVNLADSLIPADQLILLKDGRFYCEYPRRQFYLFGSEGITLNN